MLTLIGITCGEVRIDFGNVRCNTQRLAWRSVFSKDVDMMNNPGKEAVVIDSISGRQGTKFRCCTNLACSQQRSFWNLYEYRRMRI